MYGNGPRVILNFLPCVQIANLERARCAVQFDGKGVGKGIFTSHLVYHHCSKDIYHPLLDEGNMNGYLRFLRLLKART